uniref:Uncharacterized protein n=1 Tax=Arundo donax TaxID=35708 RepID=A0A0A9GM06_ARUDO
MAGYFNAAAASESCAGAPPPSVSSTGHRRKPALRPHPAGGDGAGPVLPPPAGLLSPASPPSARLAFSVVRPVARPEGRRRRAA